jgi:hypothetical protein
MQQFPLLREEPTRARQSSTSGLTPTRHRSFLILEWRRGGIAEGMINDAAAPNLSVADQKISSSPILGSAGTSALVRNDRARYHL